MESVLFLLVNTVLSASAPRAEAENRLKLLSYFLENVCLFPSTLSDYSTQALILVLVMFNEKSHIIKKFYIQYVLFLDVMCKFVLSMSLLLLLFRFIFMIIQLTSICYYD